MSLRNLPIFKEKKQCVTFDDPPMGDTRPAPGLCPPPVAFVPEEPFAAHRPENGKVTSLIMDPVENGDLIHGVMTRNFGHDCRLGYFQYFNHQFGGQYKHVYVCIYIYKYHITHTLHTFVILTHST